MEIGNSISIPLVSDT